MPNNQIMSMEGQLCGMPLAGPESFSQQQLDYLKRALGVDETVLWSGTCSLSGNITLLESASNFERIKVYWCGENDSQYLSMVNEFSILPNNTRSICACSLTQRYSNGKWNFGAFELSYDSTNDRYTMSHNYRYNMSTSGIIDISNDANKFAYIHKVVGIHRIAGGNQ